MDMEFPFSGFYNNGTFQKYIEGLGYGRLGRTRCDHIYLLEEPWVVVEFYELFSGNRHDGFCRTFKIEIKGENGEDLLEAILKEEKQYKKLGN